MMEDDYFAAFVRMVRVTHGSETAKEAHDKLIKAGYVYYQEEACYDEPLTMLEARGGK